MLMAEYANRHGVSIETVTVGASLGVSSQCRSIRSKINRQAFVRRVTLRSHAGLRSVGNPTSPRSSR
jgi:hypothetical protein